MANPNPVKKWNKGESGNLSGRPRKDRSVGRIIEEMLEMPDGKMTRAEKLVETLYEMATVDKDIAAIKVILERTLGRVPTTVEITGDTETLGVIRLPMKLPEGAPVQTEFGEKVEFIED
jgi:hypothetical protein